MPVTVPSTQISVADKRNYDLAYLLCLMLSRSVSAGTLTEPAKAQWNVVIDMYIQSVSDEGWRDKGSYLLQRANEGVHPFKALLEYQKL